MDMRPIPPFSLREFGDLVSAALDPPSSSSSSSTAFPSSSSTALSSSPSTFSLPLSAYPTDSKAVSVSRDQREEKERQRQRESQGGLRLRTMLTRFKRRASAFVGGGSGNTTGPSPNITSSSSSSERWTVVPSPSSATSRPKTRPTSPSLYRIPELRLSTHITELFVPFVPPVVQYEKQRAALPNFNYNSESKSKSNLNSGRAVKAHTISAASRCGSNGYSSTPSLHASLGAEAEHMYAHAHAASCLSFRPPLSPSTSSTSSSSAPTSSQSSSPSTSSCSSAASSNFPPTPTMFALPSPSASVSERRWSVTSSSGEVSNPFVEKPPRSPPCIPSFNAFNNNTFPRRRLPSSATLPLSSASTRSRNAPPPMPPPVGALPPLPPLRVQVNIEVERTSDAFPPSSTSSPDFDSDSDSPFTPTHPYALASPILPVELLDAFPLPPQHTPTPSLRAPSLRAPSLFEGHTPSLKRTPSLYAHSMRSTRSLSRVSTNLNLKRAPSFHLPTSTFSTSRSRGSALPTPPPSPTSPSPPTRSRPRLPVEWESEGRTEGRIVPVTPPRRTQKQKRASSPFPLLSSPSSQLLTPSPRRDGRDWIQFESPDSKLSAYSKSSVSMLESSSPGSVYSQLDDDEEYHSACSFSS
ncbi:hypothetical protein C8R43DRAFT_1245190 [Mycena crocata]|nr:hypothetical protein C8R43DRAFT_1245190 [Mycena crocata]